MTMPVKHAVAMDAAGAVTCGDSGVACAQSSTGVYTLTLAVPMPVPSFGAALVTRRGTALRYLAAVEHTSDYVKRLVLRDTANVVLDSAVDVLLFGAGNGNREVSQRTKGSVVGSSGALFAGSAAEITPARTGAGVYTLTLPAALAAADCPSIQVARRGTGLRWYAAVEHTSDLIKTVRIVDAGLNPLDSDFDFSIWELV